MSAEYTLQGTAAAPGIAIGPAIRYHLFPTTPVGGHPLRSARLETRYPETNRASVEIRRLDAAMAAADAAMAAAEEQFRAAGKPEEAHLFGVYRMLLNDPRIYERALDLIVDLGRYAGEAIIEAGKEQTEWLARLAHPYLKHHAADVRTVVGQVQRILDSDTAQDWQPAQPGIIVAYDLGPFELISIPREYMLGFALAGGGPTAHSTILARALGLPAVIGLGPAALTHLRDDVLLALDGEAGQVIIAPNPATLDRLRTQAEARTARQTQLQSQRNLASITRDGQTVTLLANVASVVEARMARELGAAGVGSLRTEILFLDRPTLPDEDEQIALYRAVAAELPGLPIVARTLDIGGDKHLPAFPLPHENNPFLGWRGIRIGLSHPEELLLPQLRAMLRAGATADIRIVVPMITTIAEFRQVRALLHQAHEQLIADRIPCAANPQLGVLIEVPAAALAADVLAREADFISIGTNDLLQYTLACDRTSQHVAGLYQPLEPAVLHLIARTIEAAHRHGRRVSLCGEMASDTTLTALLIGMGVDELSCVPTALPGVRAAIRATDAATARQVACAALTAQSLDEVRSFVFTAMPQP